MNKGGFEEEKWREIAQVIRAVKPVEKVEVFGSRAKGNWRVGFMIEG